MTTAQRTAASTLRRLAAADRKDTRTAAQSYAERQERINDQLAAMGGLVQAHQKRQEQDPRNWGFAGDLAEVESLLRRAAEMLGQQRAQGDE